MHMSRSPRLPVRLLFILALSAALAQAQGNVGVIISEVVHGPSIPPVGGVQWPSYIELVNIQIANPVAPPPTPIGTPANNATLTARVAGLPALTFSIPAVSLGGNVQPAPAPQPTPPPTQPAVLVIASGTFPPGVTPQGIVIITPASSAFFSGPNAALGAPGIPFELCFNNPATGLGDRIHLGPPTGPACSAQPFNNTQTFQPANGVAMRWTYVDSNTDLDFDSSLQPSPGTILEMAHVNGFFFGTTTSPTLGGAPLVVAGSPTSGTLQFPLNARVKSVHFVNAFFDRQMTNQAFDPVINAQVSMNAAFTAQPATMSPPGFLPGLQILSEMMQITAVTPAGTGILGMPMNLSTQVGSNIGPSYTSPTDIRPERIFSDLVGDATPFVIGTPTPVEIDVIPPSTGGNNQWCEIIVYDYAGNEYRAKVKNWPPGGACGGPLIGLGTDGAGSFTLIDLCFNPGSQVANLFSTSPAATCGGPLLPPGGICPDTTTAWILSPPQFGAPPFFTIADAGGMYLFQVPTGTLAAFIGITFEALGIEYTAVGAIVQQSGVNMITL
jgi:hypothetical protein